MAEVLYEIWRDASDQSLEMSPVTMAGDELRQAISRSAIRVHSYRARSFSDAYQKMHDWCGYGEWSPHPGFEEHVFTDEEEQEQRRYLEIRNCG